MHPRSLCHKTGNMAPAPENFEATVYNKKTASNSDCNRFIKSKFYSHDGY